MFSGNAPDLIYILKDYMASKVREMWLLKMTLMGYSHMDSMHLSMSIFNTPVLTA